MHKVNSKRNSRSPHARHLWYTVAAGELYQLPENCFSVTSFVTTQVI